MNKKENINAEKQPAREPMKRRYEISACVFLFGVAMIIIGVFL